MMRSLKYHKHFALYLPSTISNGINSFYSPFRRGFRIDFKHYNPETKKKEEGIRSECCWELRYEESTWVVRWNFNKGGKKLITFDNSPQHQEWLALYRKGESNHIFSGKIMKWGGIMFIASP